VNHGKKKGYRKKGTPRTPAASSNVLSWAAPKARQSSRMELWAKDHPEPLAAATAHLAPGPLFAAGRARILSNLFAAEPEEVREQYVLKAPRAAGPDTRDDQFS
jgi:hypothetical protein